MKRILTIQDFSCLGKCSTTVALPTISALGIEVVALPTTILSCHTGFDEYEIIHIEDRLHNMTKCWDKENIKFDGIYIGYLGNVQAIIEAEKIIKKYSNEKALVMIDPVLGDGGMLYDGFDNEYKERLKKLTKMADIITPNLTEALLLLGEDPNEINTLDVTNSFQNELVKRLKSEGYKSAVITGVEHVCVTANDEKIHEMDIVAYNSKQEYYFTHQMVEGTFPGAGDLFSSVMIGLLVKGRTFEEAIEIAYKFILKAIKCTTREKDHNWYGVNFEEAIPYLIETAIH